MFSLFNFWFETVLECASCPRVSLGFKFMPVACTKKKKQNKTKQSKQREEQSSACQKDMGIYIASCKSMYYRSLILFRSLFYYTDCIPENCMSSVTMTEYNRAK